jgi:hypothetical protein
MPRLNKTIAALALFVVCVVAGEPAQAFNVSSEEATVTDAGFDATAIAARQGDPYSAFGPASPDNVCWALRPVQDGWGNIIGFSRRFVC